MADHDQDRPGELPSIQDEAGESPMWLPALGLALLLLGAVFLVWRSGGDEAAPEEVETAEAAEAPAAAAPAAAAPAAV